jgi:hypothetical protein
MATGGLSPPAEKSSRRRFDLEFPERCHLSGDAKTMANVSADHGVHVRSAIESLVALLLLAWK